jgi:RNA polymerase sigma factor (TIGR02999 family)
VEQTPSQITAFLRQWSAGDKEALNQLLPLVYTDLRRLAKLYLHSKNATIQPTALVSAVYLRLMGTSIIQWENRAHFFAVVAQLMRRLYVDRHRAHIAAKRGGEQVQVTFDPALASEAMGNVDLLDLDQALHELEAVNPRGARIIDLRFFAGLSLEEVADVTETSVATVKRDWTASRAWLKARLNPGAQGAST